MTAPTAEERAALREYFAARAEEHDHPGTRDGHARWLRALALLDDYERLRAFVAAVRASKEPRR